MCKFATVAININSVYDEVLVEPLSEKTISLLYGKFDNKNFRGENNIFAKFEIPVDSIDFVHKGRSQIIKMEI